MNLGRKAKTGERRRPSGRTRAASGARLLASSRWREVEAFTLLEVIIASAIFFMAALAVLQVVTSGLAAARALQQREADAGMIAGVYSYTNILVEETASGDFEDLYPDLYPGYSWYRETVEVASNGLFQADFTVTHDVGKKRGVSETHMSILLYRPGSPPGSASRGLGP